MVKNTQDLPESVYIPIFHEAYCDNCDADIYGIRYKCSNCENFDLCENCETLWNTDFSIHDVKHAFLKLYTPLPEEYTCSRLLNHTLYPEPETETDNKDQDNIDQVISKEINIYDLSAYDSESSSDDSEGEEATTKKVSTILAEVLVDMKKAQKSISQHLKHEDNIDESSSVESSSSEEDDESDEESSSSEEDDESDEESSSSEEDDESDVEKQIVVEEVIKEQNKVMETIEEQIKDIQEAKVIEEQVKIIETVEEQIKVVEEVAKVIEEQAKIIESVQTTEDSEDSDDSDDEVEAIDKNATKSGLLVFLKNLFSNSNGEWNVEWDKQLQTAEEMGFPHEAQERIRDLILANKGDLAVALDRFLQ